MYRLILLAISSIFLNAGVLASVEVSSIWQSQLSIKQGGKVQKFEHSWQPELKSSISSNLDMALIGRLRLDTEDNLGYDGERLDTNGASNGPVWQQTHFDVEIREWYVDTELEGSFWRLGKQQVVWGQADGLKVLDVVNPQSYREFTLQDFDESRIPLWMVNGEFPISDNSSLQLLWIADQTYHEFANVGSDYQMTSPLLVPQAVEGVQITGFDIHKPNNLWRDSELGFRYSQFINGWDLTFNYLYHYTDTPVFYQQVTTKSDATFVEIDAHYERNNLLGFTASKAFSDWTLRTEVGYSTDAFQLIKSDEENFISRNGVVKSGDISSVIGLDWQGLSDGMLSVQWFMSSLLNISDEAIASLVRPKRNHILSFLYQQNFVNDTWQVEALALHGLEESDTTLQLQLSYMLEDNVQVWISADIFDGPAASLFGQFDQSDRLSVGFEWGF